MTMFMAPPILLLLLISLAGCTSSLALQSLVTESKSRRSFFIDTLTSGPVAAVTTIAIFDSFVGGPSSTVAIAADLKFSSSTSGLEWADAKIGSGAIQRKKGDKVAIDYVMSTTGARYGSKIYSTADRDTPYRWTLGDGSTIPGLEEAIIGGDGIPPMMPGGIRRVVIPKELAFDALGKQQVGLQIENCEKPGSSLGPIPPQKEAFEEYQRFKNIYCNSNRPYQPDLVMDIKLYGARN